MHVIVSGTTLSKGREVADSEFKGVMGFIDQEDTMLSTLTVYRLSCIVFPMRLPRDGSL